MKYARIWQQVMFEPWQITPAAHASIVKILQSRIAGEPVRTEPLIASAVMTDSVTNKTTTTEFDLFGEPLPQMEIENGIATIPVYGIMGKHVSLLEKSCGVCDMAEIEANLREAESQGVKAIILDIDSPGGAAQGTSELSDVVGLMSKKEIPIYAFTDGQMCSAAYSLAAGANGIFCTLSASVGCIGTVAGILTCEKAYEMAGLEMNRFRSGDLKGIGMEGLPLSKEEKDFIQGIVDQYSELFFSHVKKHRGAVTDDSMRGQFFLGKEAANRGLVDGIVGGIDDVKARILTPK